jgi:hypothetical protein
LLWRTQVAPRLSDRGRSGPASSAASIIVATNPPAMHSEWTALDELQLIRLLTDSAS